MGAAPLLTEQAALVPLLWFAAGVLVCAGLGLGLLRVLRVGSGSPALRLAVALGAGMGLLSLYVLAVGLLGGLRHLPWLLLAPALAAMRPLYRQLRHRRRGEGAPWSWGDRALAAFLAASGLVALLAALAPSNSNDWDGLSYHLAVPALYLRHGGIYYLPWLSHSNFPFLQEMLYLAGLALSGQGLAKLFHWLAGGVAALAAFALVRDRADRSAGLLAAAVLVSAPVVAWEATAGMTDLALTMYLALAAAALLQWDVRQERGWLALSGLMLGFALGVKVTAAVMLPVLAALVVLRGRAAPGKGSLAGQLALLLAPAALVALPWYVKSYLWTGNPTYPFLYGLFGGRYWSQGLAAGYRAEQLGFGMGRGLLAFLLVPWHLTLHPAAFANFPHRPLIYNSLGPLFLALGPVGLACWRRREVAFLAALAAVWLGAWFLLCQHLRYALPGLVPLAALAGLAGSYLLSRPGPARQLARAGIAAALCLSLAIQLLVCWPGAAVTLGARLPAEYLAETMPEYAAFERLNALPQGSRIITLGETRGFYLRHDYLWGEHSTYLGLDGTATAGQLLDRLHALGVTHLLVGSSFLRTTMQENVGVGKLLNDAVAAGQLRPLALVSGELILQVGGAP